MQVLPHRGSVYTRCGEVDRSVVMRSPYAGDALDPPLWIVPSNKAPMMIVISISLYLSHSGMGCKTFHILEPGVDGPPERTGQVAHARYAARSSVSW